MLALEKSSKWSLSLVSLDTIWEHISGWQTHTLQPREEDARLDYEFVCGMRPRLLERVCVFGGKKFAKNFPENASSMGLTGESLAYG